MKRNFLIEQNIVITQHQQSFIGFLPKVRNDKTERKKTQTLSLCVFVEIL